LKKATDVQETADVKSVVQTPVNIVVSAVEGKVVLNFSEEIILDPTSAIKVSEQIKTAAIGMLRKKP
jgi:cytoskeletal protein CcmA (bactofilin family)